MIYIEKQHKSVKSKSAILLYNNQ